MEKECIACGGEIYYDWEHEIKIVDDFIVFKGDAWCQDCKKEYSYEITYLMPDVEWHNEIFETED